MAKYFDVYTQIPGINPCPQVWVVEDDPTDGLVSFRDGLMYVENIVGTTVKELSNTKRLPAGKNISCAWSNHDIGVMTNEKNFKYCYCSQLFQLSCGRYLVGLG